MKFALTIVIAGVISQSTHAASVRAEAKCPLQPRESCRWEIFANVVEKDGRKIIRVEWEKSVLSRHTDKPHARPLSCNVDRAFDENGGGYLRVWFKGEKKACDAMKGDPATCGVRFLSEGGGGALSPIGFEVTAPKDRVLERVENFNTLALQCGDFRKGDYGRWSWESIVGWDALMPWPGIYTENRPLKP